MSSRSNSSTTDSSQLVRLGDLLGLLRHYRLLVLLSAGLAMLLAGQMVRFAAPTTYSAATTLVALPLLFGAELRPPGVSVFAYDELIRSDTVIRELVARLRKNGTIDDGDRLELDRDLRIRATLGRGDDTPLDGKGPLSAVFELIGRSREPGRAAAIANAWAEVVGEHADRLADEIARARSADAEEIGGEEIGAEEIDGEEIGAEETGAEAIAPGREVADGPTDDHRQRLEQQSERRRVELSKSLREEREKLAQESEEQLEQYRAATRAQLDGLVEAWSAAQVETDAVTPRLESGLRELATLRSLCAETSPLAVVVARATESVDVMPERTAAKLDAEIAALADGAADELLAELLRAQLERAVGLDALRSRRAIEIERLDRRESRELRAIGGGESRPDRPSPVARLDSYVGELGVVHRDLYLMARAVVPAHPEPGPSYLSVVLFLSGLVGAMLGLLVAGRHHAREFGDRPADGQAFSVAVAEVEVRRRIPLVVATAILFASAAFVLSRPDGYVASATFTAVDPDPWSGQRREDVVFSIRSYRQLLESDGVIQETERRALELGLLGEDERLQMGRNLSTEMRHTARREPLAVLRATVFARAPGSAESITAIWSEVYLAAIGEACERVLGSSADRLQVACDRSRDELERRESTLRSHGEGDSERYELAAHRWDERIHEYLIGAARRLANARVSVRHQAPDSAAGLERARREARAGLRELERERFSELSSLERRADSGLEQLGYELRAQRELDWRLAQRLEDTRAARTRLAASLVRLDSEAVKEKPHGPSAKLRLAKILWASLVGLILGAVLMFAVGSIEFPECVDHLPFDAP